MRASIHDGLGVRQREPARLPGAVELRELGRGEPHSGTHSRAKHNQGRRPQRAVRPNWRRIVLVACQGRGTVAMRALCPVQGWRSGVPGVVVTPARTGFRWM